MSSASDASGSATSAVRPTVLILDDSLTVRMDLDEAMRGAGFDTELCADLASARALASSKRFALLVLDVLLPDGNGLDFLAEFRQKYGPDVPAMLLSTEAEVRSRVDGMSRGAYEYVGKPYEVSQLVIRARGLVRGRAEAAAAKRVLLIDDSPTFRAEIAEALRASGFSVDEAASGEEGLGLAATVRPDAIVVDGVLPGIDGSTVVRRLKSDAALRRTPCLLLTAAESAADELSALEAGADAYLRKSDDIEIILARLSALLRGAVRDESETGPSLLGAKRLLAVDDSVTYLELLGEELRREGHDVVLAHSGEEALELLNAQPVDCILLDLVMPGLSGEETCRRIKQHPIWRGIPLVMLTAHDDREAMIRGINAGADDYIAKSSDFEVLRARLRAQLRRKHFEDENRRIRERLVRKETEARFQRLIHSNLIGVLLADARGVLLDANQAFLDLIGYSRKDLEAERLSLEMLTPSELRHLGETAKGEVRGSGSATPYETELVRSDGARVPVVHGMVRLEGAETTVGFVLDRTEQRLAEEKLKSYAAALESSNRELSRQKERAEEESRFKSKFLANMSHELRTPLNAIIGFSELLEQRLFGPLTERQLEYVQHVSHSGRHLLSLVNDILDLSKIAAGHMQLAREWTAIGLVVTAVREALTPLAQKGQLTLEVSMPETLPDLYIDAVRVRQVLYNLLSNAIKFTPRGGSVRLSLAPEGKYLKVSCRDTGIGIRPEDLARLFRDFEQLEPVTGERPEGTGLGLALTKQLVELHGGRVSVESTFGAGSTFSFTLPMLRREVGGVAEVESEPCHDDGLVLIVEDDPDAAELIAAQLRAAGISVKIAHNAAAALKIAGELRPRAITLDIMMSGVDGWAVLAELKRNPATSAIPVVIISALDEPNRGLVLGAADYLMKPVSQQRLLESFELLGLPVTRVTGLRVVVAGGGNSHLDAVSSYLERAGCEVERRPSLSSEPIAADGDIDLAIVDLTGDSANALALVPVLARHEAFEIPILAIVGADGGTDARVRAELTRLARDALATERLVRAVQRAVAGGRGEPPSTLEDVGS